ncbi:hypothetical protein QFC21_000030 [Naganishia friedmannii]|uniref:Uncharacterized protein n=1 Tax=Naganishia friedmannii TaxID=89922 RepID=A0ACC2WBJ5_9TREE|nr:hypothetical protein QFC21_000030 [Naganishia friedmannii]
MSQLWLTMVPDIRILTARYGDIEARASPLNQSLSRMDETTNHLPSQHLAPHANTLSTPVRYQLRWLLRCHSRKEVMIVVPPDFYADPDEEVISERAIDAATLREFLLESLEEGRSEVGVYQDSNILPTPVPPVHPVFPFSFMSSATMANQNPPKLYEAFICGGLAGCAAVTVSNIPEVMKTRLQLQGELLKSSDSPKVYKNVFDVFRKTWANEGLRGLQRGLGPAVSSLCDIKGFYEPLRKQINKLAGYKPSDQLVWTSVTAGAGSGIIGATLGNPLFLIKARMQAYSPALPVGAQHNYRSSIHALTSVVQNEGKLGLIRGVGSAMLRTAMGSSVQLPSYNYAKRVLTTNGFTAENSYWTYLASSSFSGICVTRRYYGRTRGALYSNPFDCLWKTLRTEGFMGWYKGTTAHFLRIAPHTVITLVANELILEQYKKWKHQVVEE